ncbi:MAG: PilW family protein [Gammaproteobacteria bacterium]|nr:PilW family protein [Gammaproteobacteria bacterium]MDH4316130.1 PilW family protein [Gammaproteobacteria bacterium]
MNRNSQLVHRQAGVTLVEILVALAIGSFLMIGAIQVYTQSRHAFVVNESIARVQETAHFAMDTVEADLRMASNWGRHSRGSAVEGRSLLADPNPKGLTVPTGVTGSCGATWAFDLARPIAGGNNAYTLPCAPAGGAIAQAASDIVTARRATVAATAAQPGRLQIQSTRIQGEIFENGVIPTAFDPAASETHDLLINSYYVATDSALIPGSPTLRRKSLQTLGGAPTIVDQEIAPGVQNMQLQFGVDVDEDNTVDRYVNPGDPILDPADAAFIPGSRVITARIWLVVQGVEREAGIQDTRNYSPGDVALGNFNDARRRIQVSKTILLRNARS